MAVRAVWFPVDDFYIEKGRYLTKSYDKSLYNNNKSNNNAKRSIPAHPTLFNDSHCDLHALTMVNMFANKYTTV